MVFGFNTDVKLENATYHVQSEARQHARTLETQVFTQGRFVGKRAISYADHVDGPEFTDEALHQMLKDQHRAVLEAVRQGNLDAIPHPSSHAASSTT